MKIFGKRPVTFEYIQLVPPKLSRLCLKFFQIRDLRIEIREEIPKNANFYQNRHCIRSI